MAAIAFYGFFLALCVAIRPRLAPARSDGIWSMAEMFPEGVVEVLGGGVAQLEGDLGCRLLGIEQVTACQLETLGGEVAEHGGLECLFKAAFELVFVEADGAGDLGQARRTVDAFVDKIAGGENPFLVGIRSQVLGVCPSRAVAGFCA